MVRYTGHNDPLLDTLKMFTPSVFNVKVKLQFGSCIALSGVNSLYPLLLIMSETGVSSLL
jgi:hypothetical protein